MRKRKRSGKRRIIAYADSTGTVKCSAEIGSGTFSRKSVLRARRIRLVKRRRKTTDVDSTRARR